MIHRPGGAETSSDRAGPSRSGLGSRRVVRTAFAFSVAVHVLAISMYPRFVRTRPELGAFPLPATTPTTQGSVVIRLIEIDQTPDPERPDEPEEIEELAEPAPEVDAPSFDALPGIEIVPLGPTVAERLRPNLRNAMLWTEPPPEFFDLTLEQREELLVAGRITEWLDSVGVARAGEEAATDWTFGDADGGRWGVSPRGIHLGDITIPLPNFTLGTPVGKRDEANRRLREYEEIARQAGQAVLLQSWKERSEAIRARRDRERAAAQPDTTRGR